MARSIGRSSAKEWKSQLDTDDQNMAKGISKLGGQGIHGPRHGSKKHNMDSAASKHHGSASHLVDYLYSQEAAKGISKLGARIRPRTQGMVEGRQNLDFFCKEEEPPGSGGGWAGIVPRDTFIGEPERG
jgi:hypothetical protein